MKLIRENLVQQFTRRRFLQTAGIILAVTGFAKLFTVTGETTLLQVTDPVFGVKFVYLMMAAGVAEVVVAGFCFFSRWDALSTFMVGGIASGFVVYRIGIHSMAWERPCGCLGNLTDVLRISPQMAEWVSTGLRWTPSVGQEREVNNI